MSAVRRSRRRGEGDVPDVMSFFDRIPWNYSGGQRHVRPPTGFVVYPTLKIFCIPPFFDPIVPNPRTFPTGEILYHTRCT